MLRIGHFYLALTDRNVPLDRLGGCGIILPAARNKQPGKPGRMIFYKEIALK